MNLWDKSFPSIQPEFVLKRFLLNSLRLCRNLCVACVCGCVYPNRWNSCSLYRGKDFIKTIVDPIRRFGLWIGEIIVKTEYYTIVTTIIWWSRW